MDSSTASWVILYLSNALAWFQGFRWLWNLEKIEEETKAEERELVFFADELKAEW